MQRMIAAGRWFLLVIAAVFLVSSSGADELLLLSLDADVPVSFASDFEVLVTNTFGRTSPEVQVECRQWAAKFTERYGEEVFDSLIERFVATTTYQRLSREAEVLQSSPDAAKLARRIESLALQVPVLWKRYRNLKREAVDVSLFSGLEKDLVLRRRIEDEARRSFEDYLETYQRHNRLVAEYNKKNLGGLEFFTEHLGSFQSEE